jgi:predicted dehydrogenase
MAAREIFEVFSILTPSADHAGRVLDLAPFKHHFVVEKPMALSTEDADRMITACAEHDAKLFVVKQNHFNRPIVKLKAALDQGRFGKPVLGSVRVRWARDQGYYDSSPWRGLKEMGGGVLANQAYHHIDMLLWLLGEVESVTAMTATRLSGIQAEDTGIVLLRFDSGALGLIEATTCARPRDLEGSISILGERGSVEVGGFSMDELKAWEFVDREPGDSTIFQKWKSNPGDRAWNHRQNLEAVIANLRKENHNPSDGLESRRSVEVLTAIYEAAESGRTVKLDTSKRKPVG